MAFSYGHLKFVLIGKLRNLGRRFASGFSGLKVACDRRHQGAKMQGTY